MGIILFKYSIIVFIITSCFIQSSVQHYGPVLISDEWSTCGEDAYLCLPDPPKCKTQEDCRFSAGFNRSSTPGYIQIRLRARSEAKRPYVAIRFAEEKNMKNSTMIFCSPKDQLLRFGFTQDGILHFAEKEVSEKLSVLERAILTSAGVECDFRRIVEPEHEMLIAKPLNSSLYISVSTGEIGIDGFPLKPNKTFTPKQAVDFYNLTYDDELIEHRLTLEPDPDENNSTRAISKGRNQTLQVNQTQSTYPPGWTGPTTTPWSSVSGWSSPSASWSEEASYSRAPATPESVLPEAEQDGAICCKFWYGTVAALLIFALT